MGKKITILIILGLTVVVGGFWYVQRYVQDDSQEVVNNEQEKVEVVKKENNQETKKPEELDFEKIDTSNWKTYRNEKLGFEVKYPKGWYVEIDNQYIKTHNRVGITFSNFKGKVNKANAPLDLLTCNIDIYNNNNNENNNEYNRMRDYVRMLAKNQYHFQINLPNCENNIEIYLIYKDDESVVDTIDMVKPVVYGFLYNKNIFYTFRHATETKNQKKNSMICVRMIKSFKLTK